MNIEFVGYEYGVNDFYTSVRFKGDYSGEVHLQTPHSCDSVHNYEGDENVDKEIEDEIISMAENWLVQTLEDKSCITYLSIFLCEDAYDENVSYDFDEAINNVKKMVEIWFENNPAFNINNFNIDLLIKTHFDSAFIYNEILLSRTYTHENLPFYEYLNEDNIFESVIHTVKSIELRGGDYEY